MKRILILNGSFCEIPLIEECHSMGYYVITTGNMPELVGHKYSDEYIKADYSDYDSILDLVVKHQIDAVLSCANDFGSITASYVDEKMGWMHHDSFETAKLLHHKDLFKKYIQSKNYPTPISKSFSTKETALGYITSINNYPIIVKANDLTGGKGILKAMDKNEAIIAVTNAFDKSRSKTILIEPYITGDQQTFVTFIHKRKVVSYASCDSFSFVNPYLIQEETLPAKGIENIQGRLIEIIEEIAKDLKLKDGIFAFQYIRNGNDFKIIEMMRRPFGNQFLKLVEYNTDFPWHKAQIIAETGGDWNIISRKKIEKPYCGHFGVMVNQNGRLVDWNIPTDIDSHIFKKFIMKRPGERITDYNNERVAFLHFEYNNYDEMIEEAKAYYDRIKVTIA